MTKVSVIVATYNIKKEIVNCLSSLHNQTLREIEFLIVDDGSTDGTSDIVKKYLDKIQDSRFKYVKKENGGISDVRNYGLKYARGGYIWFVDGDDEIVDKDAILKMYTIATSNDLDVLDFNYRQINGYHGDSPLNGALEFKHKTNVVFSGKEFVNEDYDVYVWHYLFRRNFLKEIGAKFPVNVVAGEDLAFVAPIVYSAQKIMFINNIFYYYLMNDHSITQNINKRLIMQKSYLNETSKLLNWICKEEIPTNTLLSQNAVKRYLSSIVGMCATDVQYKVNKKNVLKMLRHKSLKLRDYIRLLVILTIFPGKFRQFICKKIW